MSNFKKGQNQNTEVFNPRTGKFEPVSSQSEEYQSICEDYTPVDYGGAGNNAPQKNQSVTVYVVIIVVLALLLFFLTISLGSANNKYNQLAYYTAQLEQQIENMEKSQTVSKTERVEEVKQSQKPKSTKYNVEILNTYIDYDKYNEEQPVLLVEYSFTNNTDEAKSWMVSVSDKVFQNGIECGGTAYHEDVNSEMQMNDVKPGYTANLIVAYPLYDTTNPVELEITEYITDKYITGANITLDVAE